MVVTMRMAGPADGEALRKLAGLDSRRLPPGPHLVAERDGRIDAAVSLSTDELVADPFRRTAELVELLRCQAHALRAAPKGAAESCLRPEPRPAT